MYANLRALLAVSALFLIAFATVYVKPELSPSKTETIFVSPTVPVTATVTVTATTTATVTATATATATTTATVTATATATVTETETETVTATPKPRCQRFSEITQGHWEGVKFVPESCKIQEYSREELKTCFAGRSIAFVGDSVTMRITGAFFPSFGNLREYSSDFHKSWKVERKKGDPRGVANTTVYDDKHDILLRRYSLWKFAMFDELGYPASVDNQHHTLKNILLNQTHDLVIMNVGTHQQSRNFSESFSLFFEFLDKLTRLYRDGADGVAAVPMIWTSMNPQLEETKPEEFRFQTNRLTNIYNEAAKWHFDLKENKARRIPMLNFAPMVYSDFPNTMDEGAHNHYYVDIMKAKILFHFICGPNGFTTDFLV